jgi:hypothetical protein
MIYHSSRWIDFTQSFVFFRKESLSVLLSNHEELIMSNVKFVLLNTERAKIASYCLPAFTHLCMIVGLNKI